MKRLAVFYSSSLLLILTAVGCARPDRPTIAAEMGKTPIIAIADDELMFRLSSKRYCTQADAARAMLILIEGKDTETSFEDRVSRLVNRGVWDKNWPTKPGRPITKGEAALMICRVLKIPGGLMMHLTGGNCTRYAFRELQYNKMMVGGSEWEFLSGPEMVDLMIKADEFQDTEVDKEDQKT